MPCPNPSVSSIIALVGLHSENYLTIHQIYNEKHKIWIILMIIMQQIRKNNQKWVFRKNTSIMPTFWCCSPFTVFLPFCEISIKLIHFWIIGRFIMSYMLRNNPNFFPMDLGFVLNDSVDDASLHVERGLPKTFAKTIN